MSYLRRFWRIFLIVALILKVTVIFLDIYYPMPEDSNRQSSGQEG